MPGSGARPPWGGPAAGDLAGHEPDGSRRFASFDDFLASLSQDKRKKIRQERRKMAQAGVVFRWSRGSDITAADWDFFYRCYERTYYEHGNAPYLTRDFFQRMARDMPENWLLFVAERGGTAIAASLIALSGGAGGPPGIAYGRYWGALERVDCLHFEACYYQGIDYAIERGLSVFEPGAQGEHKIQRGFRPTTTWSAHWLADPGFDKAVRHFLANERRLVAEYQADLTAHLPFKHPEPT